MQEVNATTTNTSLIMGLSSSDTVILALGIVLASLYLFKDTLFSSAKKEVPSAVKGSSFNDSDTRDFVAKMKAGVRLCRPTYSALRHSLPWNPFRRSGLPYSMGLKQAPPRSMLSVSPKRPNRVSVSPALSAISRSTTSRPSTASRKIAPWFSF